MLQLGSDEFIQIHAKNRNYKLTELKTQGVPTNFSTIHFYKSMVVMECY